MPIPVSNSRIKLSQGSIFWREVGQGSTVVFLHGSWKEGSQWLPVMQQLSDRCHCFAPDLLGFGESNPLNDRGSIALQVECLQQYLDSLNLPEIYLVGHSLGAWVAASYAIKNLERVRGLVLLSPEGIVTENWQENWLQQHWQEREKSVASSFVRFLSTIVKQLPWDLPLKRWLQTLLLGDPGDPTDKLFFKRPSAEIEAEFLHDFLNFLRVPVVVLCGDRDRPQTIEISRAYATLCPQGQLKMIPEADTSLPETLPNLVAEEIGQFLQSQSRPTVKH